jgi:hypothetical protein
MLQKINFHKRNLLDWILYCYTLRQNPEPLLQSIHWTAWVKSKFLELIFFLFIKLSQSSGFGTANNSEPGEKIFLSNFILPQDGAIPYLAVSNISGECSNLLELYMLCSPAQLLYTPSRIHQSLFCTGIRTGSFLCSFLSFFLFIVIFPLFHAFISEHNCTPLQCFYNGCIHRTCNWLFVG